MPKVNLLPLAVLVMAFFTPMTIVIPNILIFEVIGWQPPPWWAIAQLWFLPGFIRISTARFVPCWSLLEYSDDILFGSYARSDMLAYLSLSLSWIVVGLMLYVNMLIFSRGKSSIRFAAAVTTVLVFAEFILPYLILLNLFHLVRLLPMDRIAGFVTRCAQSSSYSR